MTSTVVLQLDEAVELAHALVQRIAEERGIRVLFVKGPALHRQGLREVRVSSDVDVLVDPPRFAELCDLIQSAGWVERPEVLITTLRTSHSRTFIRDGWPCDLDVHAYYPGFLADPATVFEALWARRVVLPFAHRDCRVPDRVASALILATHSLRGSALQPRHADELEQLTSAELTDAERTDAAALALVTGCAATLETVLPRLGVHVEPPATELASPELRVWRERVASGSHGAYFWLAAFRDAPLRRRPLIVWRAMWPNRHDLLVARPDTPDTAAGRLRARTSRWWRGFRSLPRAARAMATHRRRPRLR